MTQYYNSYNASNSAATTAELAEASMTRTKLKFNGRKWNPETGPETGSDSFSFFYSDIESFADDVISIKVSRRGEIPKNIFKTSLKKLGYAMFIERDRLLNPVACVINILQS
jgi:hypothetical protein